MTLRAPVTSEIVFGRCRGDALQARGASGLIVYRLSIGEQLTGPAEYVEADQEGTRHSLFDRRQDKRQRGWIKGTVEDGVRGTTAGREDGEPELVDSGRMPEVVSNPVRQRQALTARVHSRATEHIPSIHQTPLRQSTFHSSHPHLYRYLIYVPRPSFPAAFQKSPCPDVGSWVPFCQAVPLSSVTP